MADRSPFIAAILRENATVGWFWRLIGAFLAGAFILVLTNSEAARTAVHRIDAQIIDIWQRLSGPDEPSGEVIVVGVDSDAINAYGRWPWPREKVAELVEKIADAGARSLAIDFLLTEPGPFSDANLFRVFRQNAPEVIALRGADPQQKMVDALSRAPTALAVAGATRAAFDTENPQVFCADPALLVGPDAAPFYVECLFYPLDPFYNVTDIAVTRVEKDVDGIVRRGSALVAQPYHDEAGEIRLIYYPAFPLAALISCADTDPRCIGLTISPEDLTKQNVSTWGTFELGFTRNEGETPPPLPLTSSYSYWVDFGALSAMSAPPSGAPPGPHSTISALSVMLSDDAELARLSGKHVALGLTRIGDVDQHTTPISGTSGSPGVVIQALAADNIMAGRALPQPAWGGVAGLAIGAMMTLLALCRFFASSLYWLAGIVVALISAPLLASWLAFEIGGFVLFSATPAGAATLGVVPVFFGRIFAVIKSWLADRDEKNRQNARLDILNRMQSGSLPFDADFSARGVTSAAICRPSREVGGDFFEQMEMPDGRIFGAVGDVMGKDVNASLVSVISKTISGAVTVAPAARLAMHSARSVMSSCGSPPKHGWRTRAGSSPSSPPGLTPEPAWPNSLRPGRNRPSSSAKLARSNPSTCPPSPPLAGWRRRLSRPRSFSSNRATALSCSPTASPKPPRPMARRASWNLAMNARRWL